MCNSKSLTGIFSVVKRIMLLIQIIVPILLIIFACFSFIQLVKNPEEKNGNKKIINQFLAAGVVFFVPLLVDVTMNLVGDSTQISSCWMEAGDKSIISNTFQSIEEKERKKFIPNATDYEKGSSASEFCPTKVSRTRTGFNNVVLEAAPNSFVNAKQNFESNSSYTIQAAAYDCENIIIAQHRNFFINGVRHRNEGGRVAWFNVETGQNVANVSVGAEGIHMDRLAYDSDRDIILVGSNGSAKMLQIDNKTKQIIEGEKYTSMSGDGSRFFKYDSHHHLLVGLSGKVVSFYQFNNSIYEKIGSITLEYNGKWDPQNFNVDGQVIYIANSNPGWAQADYGVIVFDMKTGKMVEYHRISKGASGEHIEDVVVDTEGSLWLINVTTYLKAGNYVGNAFAIE